MSATWKEKKCLMIIATVSLAVFPYLRSNSFVTVVGTASAADQRSYGENKEIATVEDAMKSLTKYFGKKDIVIGEIVEKELYYEAEIKDRRNVIVDKVIVNKRTGRIRSIY